MSLPSSPRRDARHVRRGQRSDLCIVAMVAIFPAGQRRRFGRRSTGATVSRPDWHRHNICNLRGCGHRDPLACVPILACNLNSSGRSPLMRGCGGGSKRRRRSSTTGPDRKTISTLVVENGHVHRVTAIVKCSRSRPRHRSSLKYSGHKFHLKNLKSHHAVV
jgi:hypothetical protein